MKIITVHHIPMLITLTDLTKPENQQLSQTRSDLTEQNYCMKAQSFINVKIHINIQYLLKYM